MIVASIRGPSLSEAQAQVEAARRAGADAVELRLDLWESPHAGPFLERKSLPTVVTLRAPAAGSAAERRAILGEAARGGADWVDLDVREYAEFDRGQARLILSWHASEAEPDRLRGAVRAMERIGPDILKVAAPARGTGDLLAMLHLQRESSRPSCFIAQGEWGEPLRILYARYGGRLTYAAPVASTGTAPGQLTVSELVRDFRVKAIDRATAVYAVVGDPVAHARSPAFFNRCFQELGWNARCVRVRLDDAARLRETVQALEARGVCVTAPHKVAAMAAVDAADEAASAIGAINTIVVREGRLGGHNTDVRGVVDSLRTAAMRKWRHGIYGMRALVLGAGGMARAATWGLRMEGARVTVAARTFANARRLADELGCDYVPWERMAESRPHVVVNATPVGMEGDVSPVPRELWRTDMVALDAVHTPRDTRFLREARQAGTEVADGLEVYVRQAARQLALFGGREVPSQVLKEFGAGGA